MKKLFLTVAAILGIAIITGCSGSPDDKGGGSKNTNTISQKTIKDAPDAVGDIVLKDGKAIAYYDGLSLTDQEKADAIAVIFYAGGNSELGDRILGVGLYQESKLWIGGTGRLGYHRSNALSETDGLANQNAIEAYTDFSETDYPAFYWTDNYDELIPVEWSATSGFGQNWYIPAKKELKKLLDNRNTINKALTKISDSAVLFKAPTKGIELWWTSTDATSEDASQANDYLVYTFMLDDTSSGLSETTTKKQSNNFRMTCAVHIF